MLLANFGLKKNKDPNIQINVGNHIVQEDIIFFFLGGGGLHSRTNHGFGIKMTYALLM